MNYDIMIPASPKDFDILPYCLRGLHHITPAPERIFIACPVREPVMAILADTGIDAEVVTDGELFDFVGQGRKPGWFQQIIKLFQQVTSDRYLIWDADLVLNRRFPVFGPCGHPHMRYYFNQGHTNVNEEYNAFMLDAFGQEPSIHMTMVCHHMLFQRDILQKMIDAFLARHPKPDDRSDVKWFYDWLLEKGPGYESHVSEYEAYAHFALEHFPTRYELKREIITDAVAFGNSRNNAFIEQTVKASQNALIAVHRRDSSTKGQWEEKD